MTTPDSCPIRSTHGTFAPAEGAPNPSSVRLGVLALLVTAGMAPDVSAQEPAAVPGALDCTSFPRTTDEAALIKRFGRENVVAAKLPGVEGETLRGTVIYPKDPTRRLEVIWLDETKRRRLGSITVRGRSEWQVRPGGEAGAALSLRSGLADIEAANGRPFLVNGFAWDMGGFGAGWQKGKLEKLTGGCYLGVRFSPDPKAPEKARDKVAGDKQFSSADQAMRAVRPVLQTLSLEWTDQ